MIECNTREMLSFLSDRFRQMFLHQTEKIEQIRLSDILQESDGYFLACKNVLLIGDFIRDGINRVMLPTEKNLFHCLLVDLAVFVCEKTYGGTKSAAEGIDLEFEKDSVKYIVTIKSGPNWGNSRQIAAMKRDFNKAKRILHTNAPEKNIVAICGCGYGRDNNPDKGEYQKYCGQKFWEFVSGNEFLYTEIIEPLGHKAKERNEKFLDSYSQIINKFTMEFANEFCTNNKIDWENLVKFNSSIVSPKRITKETAKQRKE
jgi:hypothetical protein